MVWVRTHDIWGHTRGNNKRKEPNKIYVNGCIYTETRKEIPGRKQVGKLHTIRSKPPHKMWLLTMPLYAIPMDPQYLINQFHTGSRWFQNQITRKETLKSSNQCAIENTSSLCIGREKTLGLEIDWNYRGRHIKISMKNFINQSLHNFQHPLNQKPTN